MNTTNRSVEISGMQTERSRGKQFWWWVRFVCGERCFNFRQQEDLVHVDGETKVMNLEIGKQGSELRSCFTRKGCQQVCVHTSEIVGLEKTM